MTTKKLNIAALLTLLVAALANVQAASDLKFYPIKSFTVKGEMRGNQSGTYTEHVKRYGSIRVEISNSKTRMFGIKQETHQKVIQEGPWITTVDLKKRTAVRTKNPMYDAMAKKVREKGGVKTGEDLMHSMGGRKTGETGKFAGEKCYYWTIPSLGSKTCATKDGITVWAQTKIMGMKITREAKIVNRGDPGPNSAYEVDKGISVTQGPSLGGGSRGGGGKGTSMKDLFKGFMKGKGN